MIRDVRNNRRGRKDEEYVFSNEYNPDYVPADYDDDGDVDDFDKRFWDEYDNNPTYLPNEEPYQIDISITHNKETENLSFVVDAIEYDYIKDLTNDIKNVLKRYVNAEYKR